MNKAILSICAAIVLVIGGVGFLMLTRKDSPQTTQTNMQTQQQNTSSAPSAPSSQTSGRYVDYSSDVIASTKGTKILFFHAPWCPQCRALEADIKSSGVPAGVTIIKVDYDSNQALRQKYGVTIQTSLVKVDDQGQLVKKYVAYNEPSVKAVKENLL
jgi:thiol-disulfide isomerase/thioredoxin